MKIRGKQSRELGQTQLKEQAGLTKLLKNKNTTRKQYIRAGIKNENFNIKRKRELPFRSRWFTTMTGALKRIENQPDKERAKRFGRAWDRTKTGSDRSITMKKNYTKIAAGLAISKKLKMLAKKDHVHIDNDIWKNNKKKAQIVDLWHQVAKSNSRIRGEYTRSFPFIEADKHGVEFWCYSSDIPGMGKVVRKKLDALGVKYDTDDD